MHFRDAAKEAELDVGKIKMDFNESERTLSSKERGESGWRATTHVARAAFLGSGWMPALRRTKQIMP